MKQKITWENMKTKKKLKQGHLGAKIYKLDITGETMEGVEILRLEKTVRISGHYGLWCHGGLLNR